MSLDLHDRTLGPENYIESYDPALMDDECVILTQEEFDRMAEYSTSIPTGKVIGKVWKAGQYGKPPTELGNWYFREYRADPENDDMLLIVTRHLLVV